MDVRNRDVRREPATGSAPVSAAIRRARGSSQAAFPGNRYGADGPRHRGHRDRRGRTGRASGRQVEPARPSHTAPRPCWHHVASTVQPPWRGLAHDSVGRTHRICPRHRRDHRDRARRNRGVAPGRGTTAHPEPRSGAETRRDPISGAALTSNRVKRSGVRNGSRKHRRSSGRGTSPSARPTLHLTAWTVTSARAPRPLHAARREAPAGAAA